MTFSILIRMYIRSCDLLYIILSSGVECVLIHLSFARLWDVGVKSVSYSWCTPKKMGFIHQLSWL